MPFNNFSLLPHSPVATQEGFFKEKDSVECVRLHHTAYLFSHRTQRTNEILSSVCVIELLYISIRDASLYSVK